MVSPRLTKTVRPFELWYVIVMLTPDGDAPCYLSGLTSPSIARTLQGV